MEAGVTWLCPVGIIIVIVQESNTCIHIYTLVPPGPASHYIRYQCYMIRGASPGDRVIWVQVSLSLLQPITTPASNPHQRIPYYLRLMLVKGSRAGNTGHKKHREGQVLCYCPCPSLSCIHNTWTQVLVIVACNLYRMVGHRVGVNAVHPRKGQWVQA